MLPSKKLNPDFTFTELMMAANIGCLPHHLHRTPVRGPYIEWTVEMPDMPVVTIRLTHADHVRHGKEGALTVLLNRCRDLRWWLREHGAAVWSIQ